MINHLKTIVAVGVLSLAAAGPTIALGQSWTSINQRQASLETRINAGVSDGSLTRSEAVRLRSDFRRLARLERRYRWGGLSYAERADLDRRFDGLSSRIYANRHDAQSEQGWASIDGRQAKLRARIDAGIREGSLTPAEAARLDREYEQLARLERRYRRGGLTNFERADLDRRFDILSNGIRYQRADNQRQR